MNYPKILSLKNILSLFILFATVLVACKDEEEEFPITNDLRVLQVNVGPDAVVDGVADLSVLSELEFVFSHGLDAAVFEAALVVSPAVDYNISYDETGSFVTIAPDTRLEYETTYTVGLPAGTYGASGEKTIADFSFTFSTKAFAPPKITLSSDVLSFFEGETATITAKLDNIIFDAVTFDLVFSGTATGPGTDYTTSATSISIPAGSTEATFTITALEGDDIEGNETIIISLTNVVNGSNEPPQQLTISLGDKAPAMELQGIIHFTEGASSRVRGVHLNVLKDIADLSSYGIEVNTNGSTTPIDPASLDYSFPVMSATAGDQILVLRDDDEANAIAYFDACYSGFDHVLLTDKMTQNGDDAILLYNEGVAIETYGEFGVRGTSEVWNYTGSWGYKIAGEWTYGTQGCASNVGTGTTQTASCVYPMCAPSLQLQGISALLWNGSGTNGGKFVHVRALRDISDLSLYGIGVANNGGGTDGVEFTFPAESVKEGDHILIAREPETIAGYLGSCNNLFAKVYESGSMQQNGDDAVELFEGTTVIETFGEITYNYPADQSNRPWNYINSWAYKVGSDWTYANADCAAAATDNASSPCPYTFCN